MELKRWIWVNVLVVALKKIINNQYLYILIALHFHTEIIILPSKEYQINNRRLSTMDVTKYTKQTGQFLKAVDVKDNPKAVFVILSEGVMVTSEKFGNERLHIEGEFASEPKVFDCSKTNARVIETKLGTDTKKWIGKTLVLEVYRTKTSEGKMTDALNVKEVLENK